MDNESIQKRFDKRMMLRMRGVKKAKDHFIRIDMAICRKKETAKEYPKITRSKFKNRRPVKCFCLDTGKLIKSFYSIATAADWLYDCKKTVSFRSAISTISYTLSGKNNICYGYRWEDSI